MSKKIHLEDILLEILRTDMPSTRKWYVVISMLGSRSFKEKSAYKVYFGSSEFVISDKIKYIKYCGNDFVIADDYWDFMPDPTVDISLYRKIYLDTFITGWHTTSDGNLRFRFMYKPINTSDCPLCQYFEEGAYSAECNWCPHIVMEVKK